MSERESQLVHARELLEKSRYDVSILPELVKCLQSQVEDGWYDLDVNLAILKLYQFHPEPAESVVDMDVLLKILVKALMQLPEADFKLCLYLIPEHYQLIDSVTTLTGIAECVETCNHQALWVLLEKKPEIMAIIPGLDARLRQLIFDALALTYQEIPVSSLCSSLNATQDKIVSDFPDVKVANGKFIMPTSEHNQLKRNKPQTMSKGEIAYSEIVQVLSSSLY